MTVSVERVAGQFLAAVRERDFKRLAGCLHPKVQLRALQPGDAVVRRGSSAVVERFVTWFGGWDDVQTVRTTSWDLAGRLALGYRLLVRGGGTAREVEHQLYCDLADGQLHGIDLLSSGFLPVQSDEPTRKSHGLGRPSRRDRSR